MAQKTGKEETEFKAVPDTLTLCVNNCGGVTATNNMCQKCFNAATDAASSILSSTIKSSTASRSAPAPSSPVPSDRQDASAETSDPIPLKVDLVVEAEKATPLPTQPAVMKRVVNRCTGCKRKVGLTGFRCRCGDLFCSEHRYSDRHDCSYDYKAAGREAIAKENPVVRAAKIVKV